MVLNKKLSANTKKTLDRYLKAVDDQYWDYMRIRGDKIRVLRKRTSWVNILTKKLHICEFLEFEYYDKKNRNCGTVSCSEIPNDEIYAANKYARDQIKKILL